MRVIASVAFAACLAVSGATACRDREGRPDAGRARAATLPVDLGVGTGVAIVARGDAPGRVRVFARGDDADRASPAEDLVDVVTLLAALRAGVVTERTTHRCNGLNCSRSHGDVTPAQALSLSCLHFFDELGSRVGADALAPAFLALSLTPPGIPAEREARTRLAARGHGWMLTPREALRLARGLRERPPPWSPALDDGLRPAVGDPGLLRGKSAGTGEMTGWFVGYVSVGDPVYVAVRVERCVDGCAARALSIARWAVAQPRTTH
ncbi:MAG: hypothetical protein WCJ30_00585 [Deltaproteobacteria bacterium]